MKRGREIIWGIQKYFYCLSIEAAVWVKKGLKTPVSYIGAHGLHLR
jgi:hypothetical protein